MYSLVSAPVLAFDLVRLPGGPEVADVLIRALALAPYDVPALAAAHSSGPARDAAWMDAWWPPTAGAPRLGAATAVLSADPAKAVALLEHLTIGTLPDLLRMVSHEVFDDWT